MRYRVFNEHGEHVASCLHPEDAAAVVALYGDATIRVGSRVVWHEGHEECLAADSYDSAAETMVQRAGA